MALGLHNGSVQLAMDFGSGLKTLVAPNMYNDGHPHSLDVHRFGRQVKLTVDGGTFEEPEGDASELSVGGEYYIGGLPHSVTSALVLFFMIVRNIVSIRSRVFACSSLLFFLLLVDQP